jgi:hypothetical protein
VLLDGVAPDALAALRRDRPAPVAIDVGSRRLPFAERRTLLAAVVENPHAPSANPAFPTVGHELAHILYTSAAFGGRGGLSDALHGRADIGAVAALLASYDRFWPGAATRPSAGTGAGVGTAGDADNTDDADDTAADRAREEAAIGRPLPVLAVASTNMGAGFAQAVAASARRLGAERASVIELRGWGHLDVLAGTAARERVFAPLHDWLQRLGGAAVDHAGNGRRAATPHPATARAPSAR